MKFTAIAIAVLFAAQVQAADVAKPAPGTKPTVSAKDSSKSQSKKAAKNHAKPAASKEVSKPAGDTAKK